MSTNLTPYAASKLVNKALEEAGLDARVPAQMMYNYTSARLNAGKAPLIGYTPENGVDPASLAVWIESYVAKKVAAVTPTVEDPEQAEFDMAEAN